MRQVLMFALLNMAACTMLVGTVGAVAYRSRQENRKIFATDHVHSGLEHADAFLEQKPVNNADMQDDDDRLFIDEFAGEHDEEEKLRKAGKSDEEAHSAAADTTFPTSIPPVSTDQDDTVTADEAAAAFVKRQAIGAAKDLEDDSVHSLDPKALEDGFAAASANDASGLYKSLRGKGRAKSASELESEILSEMAKIEDSALLRK